MFNHKIGKQLIVNCEKLETSVALLSNGKLEEYLMERHSSAPMPGNIYLGRIVNLEHKLQAAFVDIGCGIASLLSVDCISVSRISHPSDRLRVGDRLWTVIKSIDPTLGRIFVSMRELLGTWEENASGFEIGQTVAGVVRSIESYGVFVELTPNLAGLAELREGTRDRELCEVGQRVAVYIKNIIPDRMKIKLVLIDAYRGEKAPSEMKYFIDCENVRHMDSWCYSTKMATKRIETLFTKA